jgi:hypothetical protein
LQSSPSSVPLLATSQYQQYQPTIKQENSTPQSVPTSCPQVATAPPSGKFQYPRNTKSLNLFCLDSVIIVGGTVVA